MSKQAPLIAVDVGNSAVKIGLFEADSFQGVELPEPIEVLHLPAPLTAHSTSVLEPFCRNPDARFVICSVNQVNRTKLMEWLEHAFPNASLNEVSHATLPLELAVDSPDRVGVDRLAAAFAASRLRTQGQGVIVIDLGSAITVDVVDEEGVFRGGAILTGMRISSGALSDRAEQLPSVELPDQSPPVVGTDTVAAMQAGVFWGAVGAVREISRRAAATLSTPPLFVVSGGDAQRVVAHLGEEFLCVPHLVLKGLFVASDGSQADRK